MSRADELLAHYRTKITKSGQWIAIRRYSGPAGIDRPFTDTVTRAYVRDYDLKDLVGTITQGDRAAVALVDTLGAILPVLDTDRLVTGFEIINGVVTLVGGKVVNGEESTIKNVKKRQIGETLIALEIHASG